MRPLLVLLLAIVLASAAAPSTRGRAGVGTHSPIVYGYPYGRSCPGAGIADVVDRWGMYACNCTSYVAWALSANQQSTAWFVPGAMDAWNWPNVARHAGFVVDRTPAVGAVVVWPRVARPFGHVAYVTRVEPGRRIDVAEYNFPQPVGVETYAFDTRAYVDAGDGVFIHVPQRSLILRRAGRLR